MMTKIPIKFEYNANYTEKDNRRTILELWHNKLRDRA